MAEACDFKFGTQLGFAKAHHKITPGGKVGVTLAKRAPKTGVLCIISATAESSDFKFGMPLMFVKIRPKIILKRVGVALD